MSDTYNDLKRIEAYGNGCDQTDCKANPYYPEADQYCERCEEPAAHAPIDDPKHDGWVQCSENEGGHAEGDCPELRREQEAEMTTLLKIHWRCLACRVSWWAADGDNGPCKACGNGKLEVLAMR